MKVNSVTRCINEDTFQPILKVEIEIPLEFYQDIPATKESVYMAIGLALIESIKFKT